MPALLKFLRWSSVSVLSCVLLCFSVYSQREKERWQRVYTGEDFYIETNAARMTLEPHQILRAIFQTVQKKPASLTGQSGTEYKRHLETIDFKLNERRYRLYEVEWIDSDGQTVQTHKTDPSEDWKVLKPGGMMERLFYAVAAFSPFGTWKVVDFRFGDASLDKPAKVRELTALIGRRVRIAPNSAEVGLQRCSSPSYQSRQSTRDELSQQLGVSAQAVGLNTDHVESIVLKCDGRGWSPPRSLLVKLPKGDMLMLWEGVFLVLKTDRD